MKIILITLLAALSVLVMASCTDNTGYFLIVNNANEPITQGVVLICGQTIKLNDILPTKSAPGSYKVRFDSHYDIRIEFQSGKKLGKELGYVTNGLDYQHKIIVTNTDIELLDYKRDQRP